MPNFTFQDFLKAMIPLVAGGVSAYSRPAARAISGTTGSLMAIEENRRREKESEQEMALRASEGERRGRTLSLQEKDAEGALEDRQSKRAGQRGMLDALGAAIAQLTSEAQAPGAFGGGGPLSPETIDRQTEAREVAPDIPLLQSMMTPEMAGAALEYLGKAQQGTRGRTEARGKEERAAGRETAQFEKTYGLQKKEGESQAAYRNRIAGVQEREAGAREKEATTHEKEAEAKGKEATKIDPGKLADEITNAKQKLQQAAAIKDAVQVDLWQRKLKELQVKYAQMTGVDTPAGWMATKLGQGDQ